MKLKAIILLTVSVVILIVTANFIDKYEDLFPEERYSIIIWGEDIPYKEYKASSHKIKEGILYFTTYPDKKRITWKESFKVEDIR